MHTQTHKHTHIHCTLITLVMSLYQSSTDNVVSVSQLPSLSSSGVTAVIHQWRLINQKCQQHLLLSRPVAVETSGGRGLRSTSVLSPVLGHSRSMPISASQCQFEMAGSYFIIEDYFPKWPLFTYGASERRLRLSNTSMNIPADLKKKKKKKNLYVNLFWDILKRFFNFCYIGLCSCPGCQWRPVVSTQPAASVLVPEIPTVAGVSCTTRK